jgi:predicted acyltransferase
MRDADNRIESLDVMRGISVVTMLLIICPGAWDQRFAWENHADWHGFALADLVFPAFLFCVGMAMPLSFISRMGNGATRRGLIVHLVMRMVMLAVIGLLVQAWPAFDWPHLRIPGILQRIALCSALSGAVLIAFLKEEETGQLSVPVKALAATAIGLLAGYWLLLSAVPVPGYGAPRYDSLGSWPAWLDRAVFGVDHLWPFGKTGDAVTYDPEGFLSSIAACSNVLVGMIAIRMRLARPARYELLMGAAGIGLVLVGIAIDPICPIIKKIWTPSFAIMTSGMSLLLFLVLDRVTRSVAVRPWFAVWRVLGRNALAAFVLGSLFLPVSDRIFVGSVSLHDFLYGGAKALIPDARYASLAFSLIVCAAIIAVLLLYQKLKSLAPGQFGSRPA